MKINITKEANFFPYLENGKAYAKVINQHDTYYLVKKKRGDSPQGYANESLFRGHVLYTSFSENNPLQNIKDYLWVQAYCVEEIPENNQSALRLLKK